MNLRRSEDEERDNDNGIGEREPPGAGLDPGFPNGIGKFLTWEAACT
jgi:hypothetical protein